jgi:hypothetical protein
VLEKPSKMQPALVGGLIIGVLWSVPFLSLINFCCCLGVMVGGAVATLMLVKRSPVLPVSSGDGAVVGMLAGLVGAGIYLVLGVPISLLFNQAGVSMFKSLIDSINDPQFRQVMDEALKASENQGLAERLLGALISWFVVSIISVGFATIGGLIGVSIFEKRKGQGYPPQPPPTPTGFTPGYGPAGPPPGGPQPPGQTPYGGSDPPSY